MISGATKPVKGHSKVLIFTPSRRNLEKNTKIVKGATEEELDGWMDGWMDGWIETLIRATEEELDGWMDGWMDGWRGGWNSTNQIHQ